MDDSFGRALLQAFKPKLKEDLPLLSTSLHIKLRLEQLRLAEFVRGTAAAGSGTSLAACPADAKQSAVSDLHVSAAA